MFAYGAYAHGKVFIIGGDARVDAREVTSVKAYDEEQTNGIWKHPSACGLAPVSRK